MYNSNDSFAHKFRTVICFFCVVLMFVPQFAVAAPKPVGSSTAISAPEEIPVVLEAKISSTSGEIPKKIEIEITSSGSTQGMKIETAQGAVLSGAESFKKNSDGTKTYTLEYKFTNGYQGKLVVFLKKQNNEWINTDTEFEVNFKAAVVTPVPTATPKPTPATLAVKDNTVFTAKASSVYKLKYNNEYTVGADMAVDGRLKTAWNEGADGTGIGEWIRLTPADGKEYTYKGFKIANGFQYHTYHKGDRWKKNNRVASLKVYADGTKYIGTYSIEDRYDGYETIYFDTPVKCSYLVFEIASAWEGKNFSDTCISELRPF